MLFVRKELNLCLDLAFKLYFWCKHLVLSQWPCIHRISIRDSWTCAMDSRPSQTWNSKSWASLISKNVLLRSFLLNNNRCRSVFLLCVFISWLCVSIVFSECLIVQWWLGNNICCSGLKNHLSLKIEHLGSSELLIDYLDRLSSFISGGFYCWIDFL